MSLCKINEALYSKVFSYLSGEQKRSDFVFSPLSILSVLSMTSAGAKGNTQVEMDQALGIDQNTIHKNMLELHDVMKKNSKIIKIAEAIFTSVVPEKDFISFCKKNYYAVMKKTKFPHPGLKDVNSVVEKQTNGMIQDLLKELDPNTKMVLVNCLYFKGAWMIPFKKELTKRLDFHSFGGNTKKVSMMAMKKSKQLYSEHIFGKALTLPYKGGEFSMIFLRPPTKKGEDFLDVFNKCFAEKKENEKGGAIEEILGNQRKVELSVVQIPKFKIESMMNMKTMLQKMGMKDAFSLKADFTGLYNPGVEEEELYVSEVIHKAKIIVEETGTKAAAATAVVMKKKGCVKRPQKEVKKFILDVPFYCFIVHNQSKNILFATTVCTPKF